MNILKAKAKINCATCWCSMSRTKEIKVTATDKDQAMIEAKTKIDAWLKGFAEQDCGICKSIKRDLAA